MKLLNLLAATLCISIATAQGVNLPPPGLAPGSQYRVMFVTEAERMPYLGNLPIFDAFVTNDAANSGLNDAVGGTQWRVVASLSGVDARDHSETRRFHPGADSLPLYRPDGVLIAENGWKIWDYLPMSAPPSLTGSGAVNTREVATGTNVFGRADHILGDPAQRTITWGDSSSIGYWAENGSRNRCTGPTLGSCPTAPVYGISGVLTVPMPPATVTDIGEGCATPSRSYEFQSNGRGVYTVTDLVGRGMDPNIGSPIGVTGDDALVTGVPLGFTFPCASGQLVNSVSVDPDGRILPESALLPTPLGPTSGADLNAFQNGGYDQICPWWCDFDVTAPGSGQIHLATNPGASATFTWNGVAQKGRVPASNSRLTVQCTLFADGSVRFVHENVTNFNVRDEADDLIVGIAGVQAPAAPSIDFSNLGQGLRMSAPVFEHWTSSQPVDLWDRQPQLVEDRLPLPGSLQKFDLVNVPLQSTTVFFMLGLTPTAPIDLTPIGIPCQLLVNPVTTIGAGIQGHTGLIEFRLRMPSSPTFVGTQFFLQGGLDGAPYATPVNLTNALVSVIGG